MRYAETSQYDFFHSCSEAAASATSDPCSIVGWVTFADFSNRAALIHGTVLVACPPTVCFSFLPKRIQILSKYPPLLLRAMCFRGSWPHTKYSR